MSSVNSSVSFHRHFPHHLSSCPILLARAFVPRRKPAAIPSTRHSSLCPRRMKSFLPSTGRSGSLSFRRSTSNSGSFDSDGLDDYAADASASHGKSSFSLSTWREKRKAKKKSKEENTSSTKRAPRSKSAVGEFLNKSSHHEQNRRQEQDTRHEYENANTPVAGGRHSWDSTFKSTVKQSPRAISPRIANSGQTSDVKPRMTRSLTKRMRKRTPASASTMVVDDVATVVKPSRFRYNSSDSDDEYEDTPAPGRSLKDRSVSMDNVQAEGPHLMSKIWKKLPIQARLVGKGSVDLDLQKDRDSFSRSSSAKQHAKEAEKLAQLYRTKSVSPQDGKKVRFNHKCIYYPEGDDVYSEAESYEDLLERVCKFASHDQRPTSTKIQEFLDRSLSYLHGVPTKHGQVVSVSNEEIRMWRRLALHDWKKEETAMEESRDSLLSRGSFSRASSLLRSSLFRKEATGRGVRLSSNSTTEGTSGSYDEDEDSDDDLQVPKRTDLKPLLEVVNTSINFGDTLFKLEELDDLVRLEFLVEEDGWI